MAARPVSGILLVVLRLVVEELLQDLAEGLGLFLRKVHLEVVRGTELLVELLAGKISFKQLEIIGRLLEAYFSQQKYNQANTILLPRLVLCLFEKESLILLAQGVLPGIEVIFEATHRHLAASRGDRVHHKAALRWHQGAQHPNAQRQKHHGKEAHSAGHGRNFWLVKANRERWQWTLGAAGVDGSEKLELNVFNNYNNI